MGGLDVVFLRSICQGYAERNVLPLLQELQEAQERLEARLDGLAVTLDSKSAFPAALTTAEDMAVAGDERPRKQLQQENVEEKAQGPDLAELETQLQVLSEKLDAKVSEEDVLGIVERTGILAKLNRKADVDRVPNRGELQDLEALVQLKANSRDVPSLAQVQRLTDTMSRKANSKQVPTLDQLEKLEGALENSMRLVPTRAQFEELAVEVKRKAPRDDVPSMAQLKKLTAELERKANLDQVPGESVLSDLTQIRNIMDDLKLKANLADVPTLADLKEHRTVVERKLAFLAAKLQEKPETGMDWYQPMTFWMGAPQQEDPWRAGQPWTAPNHQQQTRVMYSTWGQEQAPTKQPQEGMDKGHHLNGDSACSASTPSCGSEANQRWDAGANHNGLTPNQESAGIPDEASSDS
mmetsp:Transcript_102675/g.203840  ORF Transcript_102675/g.203840 Transcript_102675/m.203840 type:complete len:410 (-) Transcript_102675:162-1391(-)